MGKKSMILLYLAIFLMAIFVPLLAGTKAYAGGPDDTPKGDPVILVLGYGGKSSEY